MLIERVKLNGPQSEDLAADRPAVFGFTREMTTLLHLPKGAMRLLKKHHWCLAILSVVLPQPFKKPFTEEVEFCK